MVSAEGRGACDVHRVASRSATQQLQQRLSRNLDQSDHIVAAWHGHDEYIMRKTYSHAQADGLAAAGQALDDLWTVPDPVSV